MIDYRKILAEELECEPQTITDTLFPIEKFSELERMVYTNSIFSAMKSVEISCRDLEKGKHLS